MSAKPVNPKWLLSNGMRVGFDLRWVGGMWEPVIEGDVLKLMPMVIGIEADHWPTGVQMRLPSLGAASQAWAERVLSNSPCLRGAHGLGWKTSK
jgi:hypothetical protein